MRRICARSRPITPIWKSMACVVDVKRVMRKEQKRETAHHILHTGLKSWGATQLILTTDGTNIHDRNIFSTGWKAHIGRAVRIMSVCLVGLKNRKKKRKKNKSKVFIWVQSTMQITFPQENTEAHLSFENLVSECVVTRSLWWQKKRGKSLRWTTSTEN